MKVSHIDHFLVQTDDLRKTRDWYVNVLQLREGPHPDFGFPVVWIYAGDNPVIHVSEGGRGVSENRRRYLGQQSEATSGSGVIDHIAFYVSGLQDTITHLQSSGVEFTERQIDDGERYQIFLFDPNGIKVELNFNASEAAERQATITGADLDR